MSGRARAWGCGIVTYNVLAWAWASHRGAAGAPACQSVTIPAAIGVGRLPGDWEDVPQAREEAILGDLEFAVVGPHRDLAGRCPADAHPWFPHTPQGSLFGGRSQADFRQERRFTTDATEGTDEEAPGSRPIKSIRLLSVVFAESAARCLGAIRGSGFRGYVQIPIAIGQISGTGIAGTWLKSLAGKG